MSFGGHVFAMIESLKFNKRQRRKSYDDLQTHYEKYKNAKIKPIKDKYISPSKLASIKTQIKLRSLIERRKSIALSILIFLFVGLGTYIVVRNTSRETAKYINKKQIEAYEQRSETEIINELMQKGNFAAVQNDYKSAKSYYLKAFEINPSSYQVHRCLTKVYVKDCVENNIDCERAEFWLNKSIGTFGDLSEFRMLKLMLEE